MEDLLRPCELRAARRGLGLRVCHRNQVSARGTIRRLFPECLGLSTPQSTLQRLAGAALLP